MSAGVRPCPEGRGRTSGPCRCRAARSGCSIQRRSRPRSLPDAAAENPVPIRRTSRSAGNSPLPSAAVRTGGNPNRSSRRSRRPSGLRESAASSGSPGRGHRAAPAPSPAPARVGWIAAPRSPPERSIYLPARRQSPGTGKRSQLGARSVKAPEAPRPVYGDKRRFPPHFSIALLSYR